MGLSRREWKLLAWLPLLVVASSLLGQMTVLGLFVIYAGLVWGASFWADLLFVGGTFLAYLVPARLMRPDRAGWVFPLAFALHWLVYLLSWTLAQTRFEDDDGRSFFGLYPDWSVAENAWFVLRVGWPGLAASTGLTWAYATGAILNAKARSPRKAVHPPTQGF